MARGLGLSAWVSAVFMMGVLATPRVTDADDTKVTTKPGVDAKAAFGRIKITGRHMEGPEHYGSQG